MHWYRNFVFAGAALWVSGCGGGGGSDLDGGSVPGPGYTGKETPAIITKDNAAELAETAYSLSTQGSGSLTGLSAEHGKTDVESLPLVQGLGEVARLGSELLVGGGPLTTRARRTETETQACDSGEMVLTMTVDDVSSEVYGTISYRDCLLYGTTYNGPVRFDGHANAENYTLDLRFTLDGFSMQGRELIDMSGTLDTELYVYEPIASFLANLLFENQTTNKTLKTVDYLFDMVDYGNELRFEISGQVFHPDHGSVLIETVEDLRLMSGNAWPYYGKYVVEGEKSSLRVTGMNNSEYLLEVDENGDGSYDSTSTELW